MDEYISREETVKAFCEKCKGYYDGHCIHRVECDIDVIKTAPTADVQPVKHGRWIITDDVEHFIAVCSECGRTEDSRDIKDMLYCHCGARMDS